MTRRGSGQFELRQKPAEVLESRLTTMTIAKQPTTGDCVRTVFEALNSRGLDDFSFKDTGSEVKLPRQTTHKKAFKVVCF